ncbi:hypothetical protein OHB12_00435 [Nocardia sp. NBC_01730]|uniref:hypothetical protein n=1 Tax=Nocardia sp. NBC_01730 TaxID=2975998 RepID=UPI002E109414|nr:hypothetical protein OHB12_00435 [Nocardia sp. NBC_01730]
MVDVEVEASHRQNYLTGSLAERAVRRRHQPLFPCFDLGSGQVVGVDAGMVGFDITPEQSAKPMGELSERRVVHVRTPLDQIFG